MLCPANHPEFCGTVPIDRVTFISTSQYRMIQSSTSFSKYALRPEPRLEHDGKLVSIPLEPLMKQEVMMHALNFYPPMHLHSGRTMAWPSACILKVPYSLVTMLV
jgi:hypothetical protein